MHKQLPAIILAVVIIAAIIGAVIMFKAPSYGKAAVMPRTITQRLPTTQTPVTRTAAQQAGIPSTTVKTEPLVYPRTTQQPVVGTPEIPPGLYEQLMQSCPGIIANYYHEKYFGVSQITGRQTEEITRGIGGQTSPYNPSPATQPTTTPATQPTTTPATQPLQVPPSQSSTGIQGITTRENSVYITLFNKNGVEGGCYGSLNNPDRFADKMRGGSSLRESLEAGGASGGFYIGFRF